MRECAKVIEANGVEAEVVSFHNKDIKSCTGCGACSKTGKCARGNDGLNDIIEKLRGCKGLIAGAPVYFGTARGDMMSALQRIGCVSRASDKFLSGMVGGAVAVGRRGGQTLTLQEMLMFFLINDMIVPGSTYWNMVFGRQPGDIWEDKEGVETIRHFAANVANLVRKLDGDSSATTAAPSLEAAEQVKPRTARRTRVRSR
jgi:multimeric flavodoxin WrbA